MTEFQKIKHTFAFTNKNTKAWGVLALCVTLHAGKVAASPNNTKITINNHEISKNMLQKEQPIHSSEDYLKGIDVSHYQGKVDWHKVASTGVHFAFVKATQGIHTIDKQYHHNWHQTKKAGIKRGVYHYFDPSLDAQQQAKHFLSTTQHDFGELPPVIDIEAFENVSAKQVIDELKLFLSHVSETTMCKPIIYTSPGFWSQLNDHEFGEYALWLAEYSVKPRIPDGWSSWLFWQYSSKGKVHGINSPVDLSYFSSSTQALEALSCSKQ
ncbi:glycoside hydrolase family 25 protein [Flocculibacter collagenilyticus]|uniref:glycoside hydrolase family 25 protein n=1 Tax=Flocculibacter collagenilyticus TaxID=2744479 RepID=UPI0018F5B073|nr:GH25 family lysozyme [Flocculibacter collagenilyticus]